MARGFGQLQCLHFCLILKQKKFAFVSSSETNSTHRSLFSIRVYSSQLIVQNCDGESLQIATLAIHHAGKSIMMADRKRTTRKWELPEWGNNKKMARAGRSASRANNPKPKEAVKVFCKIIIMTTGNHLGHSLWVNNNGTRARLFMVQLMSA